jgi:hypothetical protein
MGKGEGYKVNMFVKRVRTVVFDSIASSIPACGTGIKSGFPHG